MAITLFGTAGLHADPGTIVADGTIYEFTPPASMVAGHLVVMDVAIRNGTAPDSTISNAGGQSWTNEASGQSGSVTVRRFWCRFNGTWTANPSIDFVLTGGAAVTGIMSVYAPNSAGANWEQDVARATASIAVSAGTLTVPAIITATDNALAVSMCVSVDDNDNTVTTAGSWSSALIGLDNSAGQGLCISVLYQVKATAGSTGTYILTENAGDANDAGRYVNQVFKETAATAGGRGRLGLMGVG